MTADDTQATPVDPPRHVVIRTNGPNRAEVLLDGQNIASRIRGFQLTSHAEEGTHLLVELHPAAAGHLLFEGMVRVAVGEPEDPGPAAARFLQHVDWEQLEQAALNRPDLDGGPGGLTRAMLRQLAEWASGRP